MFSPLGPAELLLILLSLINVFFFWRIFEKAGFPGWCSIFVIIPGLVIVVIIFLAFSKWPIHKTIEEAGITLNIKRK